MWYTAKIYVWTFRLQKVDKLLRQTVLLYIFHIMPSGIQSISPSLYIFPISAIDLSAFSPLAGNT